jgi:hypothetical protein
MERGVGGGGGWEISNVVINRVAKKQKTKKK